MDYLQAAFFWLIVVSIVVYLVVQTIRNRNAILDLFSRINKPRWLLRFADWIIRNFARAGFGLAASIENAVLNIRQRLTGHPVIPQWERMIRGKTPRGRILAYYFATIRRGTEAGFPRQVSQTPNDYAHGIVSAAPETMEDIGVITAKFQEARYSIHPMEEQQAGLARSAWVRLRRILHPGLRSTAIKIEKDTKVH
jgi:hypothetical protein